jgi:outer membrane protein insertion porin family
LNPDNPNSPGALINVPVARLVYPGGDTSIVANLEYRIPLAGPLAVAFFADFGMNMAVLQSQLRLSPALVNQLNTSPFGCVSGTATFVNCSGATQNLHFGDSLRPLAGTNYVPRMSTGVEFQITVPMINAPFRLYYAYNPLRLDTVTPQATLANINMFPIDPQTGLPTGASTFTFSNLAQQFPTAFRLREPRKTFRLTVATTF